MAWKSALDDVRALTDARIAAARSAARTQRAAGFPTPSGGNASPLFADQGQGDAAGLLAANRGWVYSAVRLRASTVAGARLLVGRRIDPANPPAAVKQRPTFVRSADAAVEPLLAHPVASVLSDPNPALTGWQSWFVTMAALDLCGRAFLMVGPGDKDRPFTLWPVPPTWVRPADGGLQAGWMVRVEGSAEEFHVPHNEMCVFSQPDPSQPYTRGLSATAAAASAIETDSSIQTAQRQSFRNGVFPATAVILGKSAAGVDGGAARPTLNEHQREQIIHAVRARFRGVVDWGSPIVLDSLIEDVKRLSTTPQEMDFSDSGRTTKERILQAYGVNPILLGEVEGANRASAIAARANFYETAINPVLTMLSQALTQWVAQRAGRDIVCWFEPLRADDDAETRADAELLLRSGALTQNEARALLLGLPPLPDGDSTLLPFSMVVEPVRRDGLESARGRSIRGPIPRLPKPGADEYFQAGEGEAQQ